MNSIKLKCEKTPPFVQTNALAETIIKHITERYPELTINQRHYNAIMNNASEIALELMVPHRTAAPHADVPLSEHQLGIKKK